MTDKRTYFVDSAEVSIGGTSATPMLYGAAAASTDFNLVGIRVSCEAGSSPAPPTGSSLLFAFCAVTGTVGGGAAVTPRLNGAGSVTARSTWLSGSTALTGLTQGNVFWSHPIPLAAGSSYPEWFWPGFERNVSPAALVAVYFTAVGGAGTGMLAKVTAEIAE